MQVGFLIRSAVALTDRWTTTHWISAACGLGHDVWVFEASDVTVRDRCWQTRAFVLTGHRSPEEVVYALTRRTVPRRRIRLARLDALFLRAAPLDVGVLAMGAALEDEGVAVVNPPRAQLLVSHKSWLASLDLPTPATLVTRSRGEAHSFHQLHGCIIVKPDRGSGGQDVFRVDEGDQEGLEEAFERVATQRRRVVLQTLLDGRAGERRLLWCDGEILGGYVRRSAEGEFRHNLKRGGTPEPIELTDADLAWGASLVPTLGHCGIRFAGLDVLDDHLLEVNAVNPGGTVYADALHGTRLAEAVVRRLLETPGHGTGR